MKSELSTVASKESPRRWGIQCVMNCISDEAVEYESAYWELSSDGQVRIFSSMREANELCEALNKSYFRLHPVSPEVRDILYRVIEIDAPKSGLRVMLGH